MPISTIRITDSLILNMPKSMGSVHHVLGKYLPENAVFYVVNLLRDNPVKFIISKPRKTKLGDYHPSKNGKPRITVNGNLNPYAFLVTTLHEFAHHIAFLHHGQRINPHGKEWQSAYRSLILPMIDQKIFPIELEKELLRSLVNVKASSCSDTHLSRALARYNVELKQTIHLEKLENGSLFELNNRIFKKGNLRRTRYVCMEDRTNRTYLVHALAEVKQIKPNEQ